MFPEFILITKGKGEPDRLTHLTRSGRSALAMIPLREPVQLPVDGGDMIIFDRYVDASPFLLAPPDVKDSTYLQRILVHVLNNPGRIGVVDMFLEHCLPPGLKGSAMQILQTPGGEIYVMELLAPTGQLAIHPMVEDTMYVRGGIRSRSEFDLALEELHRKRQAQVADGFNPDSEDGFTLPNFD